MRRRFKVVLGTLVCASLVSSLSLAGTTVAQAAGANLAIGKSYVSSLAASPSYPDTGSAELTNGVYAGAGYTNAAWQGRENVGSYTQTIDLTTAQSIGSMNTNFLQQTGPGIYWPDSVAFSYSLDNITYTGLGTAVPQTAVGTSKKYETALVTPVTARYVRMTVTDASAWVFEDEMGVFAPDPSGSTGAVISGSIVQPVYAHSFTESDWEDTFSSMKDVGMDHAILQWSIQSDASTKEVYYTSSLYNSAAGYYMPNSHDTLDDMLTAADAQGIDVWVGMNWSDDWWTKAGTDYTWLANEATFATSVINDIWHASKGYKNHTSFAGWYIPWEIDNVNYTTSTQQLHMRDGLKTIVDYLKTNTTKPVMISPFFNDSMGQSSSAWSTMWQYFLDDTTGADIDIVALQDGIGVNHASVSTIPGWLAATKTATDSSTGCQLWANIETFEDLGGDVDRPAQASRVISQIDAESPYVVKLTSYSFIQYDSQQVVGPEKLDDWQRLSYPRIGKTYTGPTNGIENKALGKSYTASVAANGTYPDTGGTELTDGVFASGLWQGEPAFQGRKNKTSYSLVVDLGASTAIDSAYLDTLKAASSNVFFPGSVEFLTSPDNITYTSRGTVSQLSDPLDSVAGQYRQTFSTTVTARYVKAIVTTGTTKWTMVDEFGVIGNR